MTWADRIIGQLVLKESGEPAESNAMFRTAAALFAKKTAIVAITGVTVIGGASLALAGEGVFSADDAGSEILDEESSTPTTIDECDALDPVEEPAADEPIGDELASDEPLTGELTVQSEDTQCPPEGDEEGDDLAGGEEDAAGEEQEEPVDGELPLGDSAEEGLPGTLDAPTDNHGAAVSQAAKGGDPCADPVADGYTNKGHCVADVATGGKKPPAAPEEAPTSELTEDVQEPAETEPADDDVVEAPTAPADKPAKGGAPAGKKG